MVCQVTVGQASTMCLVTSEWLSSRLESAEKLNGASGQRVKSAGLYSRGSTDPRNRLLLAGPVYVFGNVGTVVGLYSQGGTDVRNRLLLAGPVYVFGNVGTVVGPFRTLRPMTQRYGRTLHLRRCSIPSLTRC